MSYKIYTDSIKCIKDEDLSKLISSFPTYKQNKISQLTNKESIKQSVLSGLLLRKAFIEFGHPEYENLIYEDRYGKPKLPKEIPWFFSISHSKEMVVVVISDKQIGVDIEHISNAKLDVANRFFTLSEIEKINNAKDANLEFLKYWTAKESYLKLIGKGLLDSLSSVVLDLDKKTINGDKKTYSIETKMIDEYVLTIITSN